MQLLALLLWAASPGASVSVPVPTSTQTEARPLRGMVLRSGDRRAIEDARIIVVPEPTDRRPGPLRPHQHLPPGPLPAEARQAVSGADGSFTVEAAPGPRTRVIVIAPGHDRLEQIVEWPDPDDRPVRLYLVPQSDDAYRTVVSTEPAPEEPGRVTTRELSREEIATLPGSQGDPLRALQNLPGVARAPGGLGLLVLRGAAPNQSRVFYGEHALPRAFHGLALSTVLPADAMDGIDFLPSNAPARYGDTTGGVVAITPRRPPRDGLHGYGDIDLAGMAAMVRGTAGQGTFQVGAQRSWMDVLLAAGDRFIGYPVTRPRYSDYHALYERPGRGRSRLQLRLLGAHDRVSVFTEIDGKPDYRIDSQFHRADLVYERDHGPWHLMASPSFRFERNVARGLDELIASRDDFIVSWRAEARRPISARTTMTVGVDGEVDPYRAIRIEHPMRTADDPGPSVEVPARGVQSSLGTYATLDATFGALTLWPGLRVSAFTIGSSTQASVDPRLAGRWAIGERWAWSFGAGLYSQPYVAQRAATYGLFDEIVESVATNVVLPAAFTQLEPRAGFAPRDDQLALARAAQVSTNVSLRPSPDWVLEVGGYGRVRDHNAQAHPNTAYTLTGTTTVDPDNLTLDYGLELLVRRLPSRKLYGWIAYTLSRSEGYALGQRPFGLPRHYTGDFDQRHILAVVASYRLPRHFRLGGRFRLVSGSPFTDYAGVIDLDGGLYEVPLPGALNAARFPLFHQLDLRVDKQWFRQRSSITAYLDVQNVYNHINVEAYSYGLYNYRVRNSSVGLPILPTLGLRVDW